MQFMQEKGDGDEGLCVGARGRGRGRCDGWLRGVRGEGAAATPEGDGWSEGHRRRTWGADADSVRVPRRPDVRERVRGRGAPEGHGRRVPAEGGKPTKVPGSPPHVFGLTTSGSTLYVSDGRQILSWSGWDGTKFTKSKVVATGPKRFSGFNGIFAVPGGKLYTGVSLSNGKKADYAHGTTPYANDVLSVDTATGAIHVIAKGFRQPWQFASLPGQKNPVVSDLGQDNLKKASTDTIKIVVPGSNTGFPNCPATPSSCSKYAKPFAKFPAHASPMGLGALGNTLYAALFGGTGKGPEVVSIPAAGGTFTPLLTGFVAPVVALSTHDGAVYVGDLTGAVYSVKP